MRVVVPKQIIVWFVVLLSLGAGLVVAYVYLPAAVITVRPKLNEARYEQEIKLSAQASAPDFARFVLPAKIVDRTVEETRVVERQGAQTAPDLARGQIVLVNNRDEEQSLLPKTHLRHEATGVFFLTDTPVTIPPNNSVAMTITAKEAGASGNVDPGRFVVDKLPTSIQDEVYGQAEQAMAGGIVVETPLTPEEIAGARGEIERELKERARGELTLASGGAAAREELSQVEIEEETISAEVGSRTQQFEIKMRIKMRAFVVSDNDLLALTLLGLRSSGADEEEFVSYEPDSFSIEINTTDFERGEARVRGSLTGRFANKVGPTVLKTDNLAGLSAEEVRSRLAENPAVGEVDVQFSPFWVRSVPGRAAAVEIAIKEPEEK